MSNPTSPPNPKNAGGLNRYGIRRIVSVFIGTLVMGLILFLSAGRLDWILAWSYLGLYLLLLIFNAIYFLQVDPDLVNERGRMAENQKDWDKVLMRFYAVLPFVVLLVAGLDAGRKAAPDMPLAVIAAAYVVGVFAYVVIHWVMRANAYLSTVSRIQEDRGQQVVSRGPYRFVRHPMYNAMILMWLTTPLMLGSYWALIPSFLVVVVILIRTSLEDKMLHEELDGYPEYAQEVRYRLLPGIW